MDNIAAKLSKKAFDLGVAYCQEGRADYGLANFQEALEIERETVIPTENLHTAKIYYWIGCAHWKRQEYSLAWEHLQRGVQLQESLVGRYHPDTSASYHKMGCVQFEQEKYYPALTYLRTATRIEMWKYGTYSGLGPDHARRNLYDMMEKATPHQSSDNNNNAAGETASLYSNRSIATAATSLQEWQRKDLREHHKALSESIQHEKAGDQARQIGDYAKALQDYDRACKIEEFAFGSFNPTLCLIWRKVAMIHCLRSLPSDPIDWPQYDSISSAWSSNKENTSMKLSPDAMDYFEKGDESYREHDYKLAVTYYCKATQTGKKEKKTTSSRSTDLKRSGSMKGFGRKR